MASARESSPVEFLPALALIRCTACGDKVTLSRFTMRLQERIVEEIEMMRELHSACGSATSPETAQRERRWMEQLIRQRHSGRQPDRLAWSA